MQFEGLVAWLSVTLRDAQHVCWKSFRMISDKLKPEEGKAWKPSVAVAELAVKVREIEGLVRRLEETGSSEGSRDERGKGGLVAGFSEILFLVFVLAEHYGVNLEEEFMQFVNDRMLNFLR